MTAPAPPAVTRKKRSPAKPTDVRAELTAAVTLAEEHYRILAAQTVIAKRLGAKIKNLLDRDGDLTTSEVWKTLQGRVRFAPWWRVAYEDFVAEEGRYVLSRDELCLHLLLAAGIVVRGKNGDILDGPRNELQKALVTCARELSANGLLDAPDAIDLDDE